MGMDEDIETLGYYMEILKLETQIKFYEDALDEILKLDPGLCRTSKIIAAKARGKEYGDE
jgi:hypothetical protein